MIARHEVFFYYFVNLLIKPPLATARGLSVSVVSICSFLCLSLCCQNAKKNVIFSKAEQFRALMSIDDL